MSFAELPDAFFGDFAIAITLPSSAVVMGIFDNGAASVLGMIGSDPRFTGPSRDLSDLAYGVCVTIAGTTYTVREIKPDGTGITTLMLEVA